LICLKCGFNNKDVSQFCIKCGQKLIYAPPTGTSPGCNTLADGMMLQGRYRIIKQLGKGGMGVVYLTNDNRFSNRICVVKEMMEFLMNESERQKAVLRFNQEADLLASINHHNVPQVYDRFSENNRHYLVMEFVEGMDLKDVLQEHMSQYNCPIPEEDVVIFFMQLCITLKYLHNHKPAILHRDIKPSNILLTLDGRAKLVDFGIAKAIQANTQGTSIGPQGYAAPEQYKGLSDARTDIYALGATIHHLLTGRDPQTQTPFDYPPVRQFNESISQNMSDIVEWMLQMDIESRPQSVERIIERIKNIYVDIEQRMLNYSTENNKLIDIISKNIKFRNNNNAAVKNTCRYCGYENKVSSRFCVRCGKPVGSSSMINGGVSPIDDGFDSDKMLVTDNSNIFKGYPESFKEYIKVPCKDGTTGLNVILERYLMDGAEYIYITQRQPSILRQEVQVFSVIRDTQGIMQYIKPVTDSSVRKKLYIHWRQIAL